MFEVTIPQKQTLSTVFIKYFSMFLVYPDCSRSVLEFETGHELIFTMGQGGVLGMIQAEDSGGGRMFCESGCYSECLEFPYQQVPGRGDSTRIVIDVWKATVHPAHIRVKPENWKRGNMESWKSANQESGYDFVRANMDIFIKYLLNSNN